VQYELWVRVRVTRKDAIIQIFQRCDCIYSSLTLKAKCGFVTDVFLLQRFYSLNVNPHILGVQLNDLCNATWNNLTNKAAKSGHVKYDQYNTVDDCLDGCLYDVPGCLAAQVRIRRNHTGFIKCFFITDPRALNDTKDARGITLFVLTSKCGSDKGKEHRLSLPRN
jgi:hypothetical protein